MDADSTSGETLEEIGPSDDGVTRVGDLIHDASAMPSRAEEKSDGEAKGETQKVRTFGGLSPSEAASLRWERKRQRDAALEGDPDVRTDDDDVRTDVVLVRVPVRTGAIIRKLEREARNGNTQAARELRAWMSEVVRDEAGSVSELDSRTRRKLLARLLAEIEEEDRAYAPAEETERGATPASGGTPVPGS